MPYPVTAYSFSAEAKIAAHTALLNLLDSGTAAKIRIRNSSDALLGTITLTDPAGSVNGTTGQLTLTQASNGVGSADGTAAYGEICESDGTVHVELPVDDGSSPVSGYLILGSLTIVNGGAIVLVSATIG